MADHCLAASLLAVDPGGLGGAVLRGAPGPARDRWLATLRAGLPTGAPVRRVPLHAAADQLTGGLDLVATLQARRRVVSRGLLADARGGVVVLAMAERLSAMTAGLVAAALDDDGPGVIALDEGRDDERTPAILLDRLAFHIEVDGSPGQAGASADMGAARNRLGGVSVDDDMVAGLCATAAALGIASLRAPIMAVRAARAAAALAGRDKAGPEDAALAARLVLAPRATVLPHDPSSPEPEPEPEAMAPEPAPGDPEPDPATDPATDLATDLAAGDASEDVLLAAAAAAIPAGLLARLQAPNDRARGAAPPGRMGQPRAARHGRPAGVRAGDPKGGQRLNLLETLRAAAPWQRLRGRDRDGPVRVRRDDFRVTLLKQRSETTTIFMVDASGSQALSRLAETKGAVELLLAECYARRDKVAVLAFRGRGAELLLPPTRSLVRAKRGLAGLPGGGGTPLAAGIEAGRELADTVRRRGGTAALVLLTDGRGNVGLDGKGGRAAAERDAEAAAQRLQRARHASVLVDTSPRPSDASRRLAACMGARYVALPFANPAVLARVVATGAGA